MNFLDFLKVIFVQIKLWGLLFLSVVLAAYSCVSWLLPRSLKRRKIKGKVALITGGAMNIGKLVATKLASKGAKVIIWDINAEAASKTVDEIKKGGGQCFSYTVDVSDANSVRETAKKVKMEHGMVNILINNAGIYKEDNFLTDDESTIEKHFQVNTYSNFWTIRAFLPDMKAAKEGQIVTISSIAGKLPCPMLETYCASKYAVCGLDECLRINLDAEGLHNVTTTLVCPFFIDSPLFKGITANVYPLLSPAYVSDEIVDAILMRTRRVILPTLLRELIALKGLLHNKLESLASRTSIGRNPTKNLERKQMLQRVL